MSLVQPGQNLRINCNGSLLQVALGAEVVGVEDVLDHGEKGLFTAANRHILTQGITIHLQENFVEEDIVVHQFSQRMLAKYTGNRFLSPRAKFGGEKIQKENTIVILDITN
jgi:hypothetical protein